MANSLNKIFVIVPSGKATAFKNAAGSLGSTNGSTTVALTDTAKSDSYKNKIVFLQDYNEILTQGQVFGINNAADVTALKTEIGSSTDTANASGTTLWSRINAAIAAAGVTKFGGKTGDITLKAADTTTNGTVNLAISEDNELSASIVGLGDAAYKGFNDGTLSTTSTTTVASEKSVADAIEAAKKDILTGGADATIDSAYDTLKEIADWIAKNDDDTADAAGTLTKDVSTLKTTVGDSTSGLVKDVADLKAVGATKVEASTTNGNIKINDTETTVYTHPAYDKADAAFIKVGRDETGHVVLGDAIAQSDITELLKDGDSKDIYAPANVVSSIASTSKDDTDNNVKVQVTTAAGSVSAVDVTTTIGSVAVAADGALTATTGLIDAAALDSTLSSITAATLWETYSDSSAASDE